MADCLEYAKRESTPRCPHAEERTPLLHLRKPRALQVCLLQQCWHVWRQHASCQRAIAARLQSFVLRHRLRLCKCCLEVWAQWTTAERAMRGKQYLLEKRDTMLTAAWCIQRWARQRTVRVGFCKLLHDACETVNCLVSHSKQRTRCAARRRY